MLQTSANYIYNIYMIWINHFTTSEEITSVRNMVFSLDSVIRDSSCAGHNLTCEVVEQVSFHHMMWSRFFWLLKSTSSCVLSNLSKQTGCFPPGLLPGKHRGSGSCPSYPWPFDGGSPSTSSHGWQFFFTAKDGWNWAAQPTEKGHWIHLLGIKPLKLDNHVS